MKNYRKIPNPITGKMQRVLSDEYIKLIDDIADAISKKHTQNTDIALRTDKLTVDESGNTNVVGKLTFAELEALTSIWNYCEYLPAISLSPGGSGATQITPSINTIGGYRLDAETEYLYFSGRICNPWDEISDIEIQVTFEVNTDNSGGADADTIDLSLLAYYKGSGELINKTQTVETVTVVGKSAQYKQFIATFYIDYDKVDNVVQIGDIFALRLNLETDTSEVDNVIINFIRIMYKTKYPQLRIL